MKLWSKRLSVLVAALTIAWLTGIAFATSGTKPSTQSLKMAPGTAIPLAAGSAFAQAPAAGRAQTPAPAGQPTAPAPAGRAQAPAAPPKPGTSDAVFKNIQVLKGLPIDEFMGTMGVFTTSLSLCCGNCHTGAGTSNPKWEDDTGSPQTGRPLSSTGIPPKGRWKPRRSREAYRSSARRWS